MDLFSLMREIDFIAGTNRIIPAKVDFSLRSTVQWNEDKVRKLQDEIKKISDEFVFRDEKGEYQMKSVGEGDTATQQLDFKDKKAYDEAINKLMSQPTIVKVHKIKHRDLGDIVLDKGKSTFEVFNKLMMYEV